MPHQYYHLATHQDNLVVNLLANRQDNLQAIQVACRLRKQVVILVVSLLGGLIARVAHFRRSPLTHQLKRQASVLLLS